jgi:hypothetical protein
MSILPAGTILTDQQSARHNVEGSQAGFCVVPAFTLVTDADLARARSDPPFRQRLLTDTMDLLLTRLQKLRRAPPSKASADQIREGVQLAVKLAEMIQHEGSRAA